MPPKGKAADKRKAAGGKGKAKAKEDGEDKDSRGGKLKAANSINVRHILVRVESDMCRATTPCGSVC